MKTQNIISSLFFLLISYKVFAQVNSPIRLQADVVLTLPRGAGLAAIADGDFNHDNRRDLAVCERGLNQVALYLRSATGTYPSAKYTYAVGQAPSGLVSFNHDPLSYHADLMALSGPSSQWTMLRDDHDTTGNLVRRILSPAFGTGAITKNPYLVQADINHDGVPDFAYTYPLYFGSFVQYDTYFTDQYSPTYGRKLDHFKSGFIPGRMTLADFTRSGHLDAALPDSIYSGVHILPQFQTDYVFLQTSGRGAVDVAAVDIDTDQLPDLAVAYAGSNEVMIMLADQTLEFNRTYSYKLSASPRRVLLADLNGDHYPELLVVTADNQLRVYQHNGIGSVFAYSTLPPQLLATGVNPAMLQVAYLNDDAYPDIVVGCPGDNTIHTYLNRSNSLVTAAQASQSLAGVEVYPTVGTDQITVRQTNRTAGTLTATLLDELGRLLLQQPLSQPHSTLAVGEFPRGMYLLRVTGEQGVYTTRLILK